jgi:hypothetical protein
MTTYSTQIQELLPAVYEITSHPELELETVNAIRSAVQYYHKLDFMYLDTAEVFPPISADGTQFILDISSVLPSFRAIASIKSLTADGTIIAELEEVSSARLLDSYGYPRTDVFYIAGTVINIRTAYSFSQLQVNYFTFPNTTKENLSTWLYPDNEQAIIDFAAMKIFSILGQDKRVAAFNNLIAMHTQQILQNYSILTGR